MSPTLARFLDWTSDGFPNEDNIGLHLGNKRGMVTAAADFFLTAAAAPASLPRNLVRKLFFSNTRTGVGRACRTALEELFPVVTWWVWSAFVGVAARVVRVECPRSSTAGLIDH